MIRDCQLPQPTNEFQVILSRIKTEILITNSSGKRFRWLLIKAIIEGIIAQGEQAELKKAA